MKEMVGGCCVCSDDRGWSENPLVYCDGQSCAVAVHQACYGIVTVPSGPWYCRKCESQERSARVRCELCPSRDGALKRTDNLGWAHVVCALYIPEVRFGNVTTMEPIILQLIPQERYNKTCYICQEMGKGSRSTAGACMQCNKSGCKQQFHVTCAQQLGLLCEEAGNYLDNVKYCGYCQHHYSKLKKGGNVKTIPPYKPINHETNSSDGPSSPEKELDPPSSQPHSSGSGMGIGGSSNSVKSNNRLPSDQIGSSSTSSSSKQRKSSSVSKNSTSAALTSSSTTLAGSGSNSASINSQATSSVFTGVPTINPASTSSGTTGGNISKTGSSSSSSSSKDKDKYNKNVNKISSTNKTHDKDPSSSSTASSSSSSQRDKSSKSSKSGSSSSSSSNSNSSGASGVTSGIGSGTGGNSTNASSTANSSLPKESDLSSLPPSASTALSMITSTMKHTENGANKQDKTLAQISSAAASSARAASLSPAAIPTTLIIKPPHEPSGSNKELLSKEAIAKFTTSNFTETIVVNSDSVFGTSNTGGGSGSANAAPTGSSISTGNTMISTAGSTSVVDTGSTSGAGSKMSISGGSSFAGTGSSVAKKRKAEARSTPTLISTGDIDINRDLIKDVAVSLVPLPLNKSDNIDPASISGIEKSIKKAKTEPNSPHHPGGGGDTNLQNVSPNLIQTHASNVITSSIKHQQQSNSPQFQSSQQLQAQQLQAQQHTPSLVVSVPLSTATVPGVNLPTNNSSSSSATVNNASNTGGSSNSTPNIVSPGQVPSGSSLYQQLTQRTGEQLMSASTNRSSPVIQLQSSATNHVIQSSTHSILERQSPSMRSSPAIITSAGTQQQQQSLQHSHHQYMPAGVELNTNSMSASLAALQSASPVPMSTIQSTSSSPITPGGDGGLKITYEKQTSNTRIAALLEQEATGRRSRSQSRERSGGNGSGNGGKTRTSKKRSLQQQQQQRSSPLTNSGSSSSSSSSVNNTVYASEPTTTSRSSTPIHSHTTSSHSNASNNTQLNSNSNNNSNNTSHTNSINGNSSNSSLTTSGGSTIIRPSMQSNPDKFPQAKPPSVTAAATATNINAPNTSSVTTPIVTPAASGTHVIEVTGIVSTGTNNNQSSAGGNSVSGNSNNSSHFGGNTNSSSLNTGTGTDHGHGTSNSNNTNSNSNNALVVMHTSKKLRSSQPSVEIPSPSTSRTPDNSFGSNSSFSGGGGGGGGGGLKFSYEAQPTTNPAMIGATSTIITHQPMVKESPPSSPGSDSGMVRSNKRNRKLSTNSNTQSGAPDAKESKLFQNGVVHATHMLGNQLNPSSSVAQKMSDQLTMEMETHAFVVETGPQLVGPPFPGKVQASRANNASAPATGGPSLSSMLSGNGTATANGNTPQSLEQLLERQWEQGSQFLMEQAQHFDIASLLSCLHQLRSENIRLEEHVNNLVARRDHLLAVNARLAIPLNPAALGGVGLGGGGGGGVTGGASAGSTGSSGAGSAGSQAQFNNMHGNGSHDGSNTTSATTISSRSSRIQQHQTQQQPQHSQSHFVSNSSNQIPIENGIDFRHSNSIHQNTNSSSIRHHSPPGQSYLPSSGQPTRQNAASLNSGSAADQQSSHARSNRAMNSSSGNSAINSNNAASSGNASSSAVYQSQQQTIYNTAHQIPLLLEHHQQEHHSQQQLQQQTQQQTPQPPQPHHLRQTSPTVSSRSHKTHSARAVGAAPSVSHSHHPSHHPHHHQSHTSAHPPSHGPSPQQQSLPQRQRH
ncbi:serine-rich adhesin for platelets isoform X2 [Toxorhynchites rutilus septentrionalis]|uniref:serine-rich adhesin for platelets isoform X2 n=1 Tax=Toxorhynchites rutilus septentrionalis TaxID=329112 RepID=UPI00247AF9FD|nr:serine-rich adhesin for platelets isoform X2 [Toxorhynchites rutilus septentrionalis]